MPQLMGALMSDYFTQLTNLSQKIAANPCQSVWATANAGAGKTKVLIDRIARILLSGTQPSKILAVTYTKAAAAEMTTRLFETLGKWTIIDDEALRQKLLSLDENLDVSQKSLNKARTLFASALETPGGLKVQTIHAFCGDVLKRFPLEAGVSPGFEVSDDVKSNEIKARAFDYANDENFELFSNIAKLLGDVDLSEILAIVSKKLGYKFAFDKQKLDARISKSMGIKSGLDFDTALQKLINDLPFDKIEKTAKILINGAKSDVDSAQLFLDISKNTPQEIYENIYSIIFTKGNSIRKKAPITKAMFDNDLICEIFGNNGDEWPSGIFANIYDDIQTLELIRIRQNTLNIFQAAFTWQSKFLNIKAQMGVLDFDDLLSLTSNLLNRDEGAALWVMFKLDNGISHILIDESQDTSAQQWDLLHPLLETLESQSSDEYRSRFIVGDDKQSIYRFQGASPERYGQEREKFRTKMLQNPDFFKEVNFEVSFRTGEEILRSVDIIWHKGFGYETSAQLETKFQHANFTPDTITRSHFSARTAQNAITELWPIIRAEKKNNDQLAAYDFPIDIEREDDAKSLLAELIAKEIKKRIDNAMEVWDKDKNIKRPVTAGDFMILVSGRSTLYHRIIKRLKRHNVKVAGADLIILQKEPVIIDLLQLAQFVLCNNDDFNLACILKSAFCNLLDDDKSLLPICHNRGFKSVWRMLEESQDTQYSQAKILLNNIRDFGAHISPFDFFAKILESKIDGDKTGWELILQRFGHEAKEPVEIFLDLALNAENIGAPNLTKFIDYIENQAGSAKREFDGNDEGVKVMTIHGAKGREAPIVILPDTNRTAKPNKLYLYYDVDCGLPIWAPDCDFKPPYLEKLREADKIAQEQENQRLLYVAMTRPRDRLILCGHENGIFRNQGYGDSTWYGQFMAHLDFDQKSKKLELETIGGVKLQGWIWGENTFANPKINSTQINKDDEIPSWFYEDAPIFDPPPRRIAPSSLVDENYEPPAISPIAGDIKTRFLRGSLIHELLENLPQIPKDKWQSQANLRLAREEFLDDAQKADIIEQANKILLDEQFGDLFGPNSRAEVAIIGQSEKLPKDMIINGSIDRLLIDENEILVLDYKTNRPPPTQIDKVAPQYINQMACYRALLQETYPNHNVKCALLWTDIPLLMVLPNDLLDDAVLKLM
jgi:ATP-dependent helicase/nuclease subunit A